MKNCFNTGDRVETIDDNLQGIVKEIHENRVIIVDGDGFEYEFECEELVKIEIIPEKLHPHAYVANQKQDIKSKKQHAEMRYEKKLPVVDLHKDKIPVLPGLVQSNEILTYQLRYLKQFIASMQKRNQKKFIVIHGKGTGKLKAEVIKILRQKNYTAYDAPYNKFGFQAALIAEKKST